MAARREAARCTWSRPAPLAHPRLSEVFAELLVVEAVGNLAAAALTGIEGVDGLFPQRLIQLFQRGRLLTAEENRGVTYSR